MLRPITLVPSRTFIAANSVVVPWRRFCWLARQSSTSHLYHANYTRDDYINLSGGQTRRADSSRIYVVRANGSVLANNSGRWFSRDSVTIKPGDTVVVPLNAEHLPPLPMWQAITQIIYNIAIAAAAVHSFGL